MMDTNSKRKNKILFKPKELLGKEQFDFFTAGTSMQCDFKLIRMEFNMFIISCG